MKCKCVSLPEFGTKPQDFKIVKRIGITDKEGKEICIEVISEKRELYVSYIQCPSEMIEAKFPREPLRPISDKIEAEMDALRDLVIHFLKKGKWKEALELIKRFKFLEEAIKDKLRE